ncbi:MAG: hypothetical protein ACOH5I_13490 [Oligoflexus sp.]
MKKFVLLAGAILAAPSAFASSSCFDLGKQYALEAAADYCDVIVSKFYYDDQNCFKNPGKRDFEAGCENYIIDYVRDFYKDGYCKDRDHILKKKTREFIFKKQECDV